jgi:hypothetical protein
MPKNLFWERNKKKTLLQQWSKPTSNLFACPIEMLFVAKFPPAHYTPNSENLVRKRRIPPKLYSCRFVVISARHFFARPAHSAASVLLHGRRRRTP